MDHAAQPEDAAAIAGAERRADVQRRIDEVAGVLAETLLGMWRAKHRAERRGESGPPPEPPKPEAPRSSGLSEKPKGPLRVLLEQLGHQRLREPGRLAFEATLDARAAVLGLVEDELALGRVVAHLTHGR